MYINCSKNPILKLNNILYKIISIICCFVLTSIVIITVLQIISRYIFNSPIVWTEEMARYFYIWLCYLGAITVQRNKGHLSLDLFGHLIPKTVQVFFNLIINVLTVIALYFLVVAGYKYATTMGRALAITTNIPLKYVYFALPVCFSLITFFTLFHIYNNFKELKHFISKEQEKYL